MDYRTLGRTGWKVSTVSFGAWAIGGTWGAVDDDESMAALHRALDRGVNFFDTADVYGDGRSERLLGDSCASERKRPVLHRHQGGPPAARADGRGLQPREPERVRRSQPQEPRRARRSICCSSTARRTDVYYHPEVFDVLDDLVQGGQAAPLRRQRRDGSRRR